jgi:hypothetical protein
MHTITATGYLVSDPHSGWTLEPPADDAWNATGDSGTESDDDYSG